MACNFKAFAAGFMEDQARQINQRVAEAREYKRELKENAEASKSKIAKLRQLGNLAKSEISRLKALGLKDKHINAAIASGPKGLFDLSKEVTEEFQRRGMKSGDVFSEFEVDSLIDFSFAGGYGEKYKDMDAAEFYELSTALAKPSLGSTKDTKRGLFGTLLGIDLDDAVRARLDEDAYYDGYSVMDINEIAKQEVYESLAPGTYYNFTPTKAFTASSALDDLLDAEASINLRIQKNEDRYNSQAIDLFDKKEGTRFKDAKSAPEIKQILMAEERNRLLLEVVEAAVKDYGPRYLQDVPMIKEKIGEENYNRLLNTKISNEETSSQVAKEMKGNSLIDPKDIGQTVNVASNGIDHEIVLGTNGNILQFKANGISITDKDEVRAVIRKLTQEGKLAAADFPVDPVAKLGLGEFEVPIRQSKIPPRPSGLASRIRGVSLDYDTREEILSGKIPVPKNLRPEEWDEMFGKTHDPETGEPLEKPAMEVELRESLTPERESTIIRLDQYETKAEKDKAFDSIPIGGLYVDDDGKQYRKTTERVDK